MSESVDGPYGDRSGETAWPFKIARPQRYATQYDQYLKRGGAIKLGRLAKLYTEGVPPEDPARLFLFCHIFDQIVKERLDGDLAEVGVYKGDTAAILAEFSRILSKTVFLCDTFEGFDTQDFRGIDDGRVASAFRDTSLEAVQKRIGDENVKYVPGYFPASTVQLPDENRYCLVHIDCDLYQPIIESLNYFYPRVVPGGFIVVHDYNSLAWNGAEKAVDDFFSGMAESVVPIPDSGGSVVVRKARSAHDVSGWRQEKKAVCLNAWLSPALGNLDAIFDEGWSSSEDWGIWGVGERQQISIQLDQSAQGGGYLLELDVHAPLSPLRLGQTVLVDFNGVTIGAMEFVADKNRAVWRFTVPQHCISAGLQVLRFTLAETRPSMQLAPASGTRNLTVALHRLRLGVS